jgi:diadenosine tetraphosphate (Ap4A) HIT family hydrolase
MVDDWRIDRIGSALRGENPAVLRRLNAGFAVIGDVQFLPGYSVLLVDDMDQLGEAVERVSRRMDAAFRRVNLEILGNTDGFLHAHVWPRFEWEPTELVCMPVWLYPRDRWDDEQFALGPQHDSLRKAIRDELDHLRSVN